MPPVIEDCSEEQSPGWFKWDWNWGKSVRACPSVLKENVFMRRNICTVMCLLVFLSMGLLSTWLTSGVVGVPQSAPPSAAGRAPCQGLFPQPEAAREDINILQAALEEGHLGVYRYTSKAELDSYSINLGKKFSANLRYRPLSTDCTRGRRNEMRPYLSAAA
jgi:hypothetical protein